MTAVAPEIIYLFPGQGAQRVGMAAAFARSKRGAELLTRAEARVAWPLSRLMFHGPIAELSRTDRLQVALCVAEAASLAEARESGLPAPIAVAGHSLGELTACYAAGAFGFDTLVDLAVARGRAMQAAAEREPGGMIALSGATPEIIGDIVAAAATIGRIAVASRNAPNETVLSGAMEAILHAEATARRRGIRAALLRVTGPWHSPAMNSAAQTFAAVLEGAPIADAAVPVFSGLDGCAVRDAPSLRRRLAAQLNTVVRWDLVMRRVAADGPGAMLVELGPGKTLVGLALRNDRTLRVRHIEDPTTLAGVLAALGLPGVAPA